MMRNRRKKKEIESTSKNQMSIPSPPFASKNSLVVLFPITQNLLEHLKREPVRRKQRTRFLNIKGT